MMEYGLNTLGRMILKFHASVLNRSLRKVQQEQIENWFNDKQFFFILSLGRSGSMFLADLLNKDGNAYVCHEPTRLDFLALPRSHYGQEPNYDYISEFRKNDIYQKNRDIEFSQYGEVNSLLRSHPQAIKRNFPNVKIFHLVRDGRDVVRSMMARRTLTARDPFSSMIRPKPGDDYYEKWPGMERFEKLCWYWWVENKYLNDMIGQPLLFEKLITDFDYIRDKLFVPLEMDISREQWKYTVEQPKNSTTRHAIPHWKKWTPEQTDQFDLICGSLMESLGYYESS